MIPPSITIGVMTFFSTLTGGIFAAKFRNRFGIIAAFAAGVLIGVPLFDLLPESIKLAGVFSMPIQHIMYATALGFLFLYILNHYISVHRVCENGVCRNIRHSGAGIFNASELSVHSFMDGFAIGLSFQVSVTVGIVVAVAVLAHDFSDGITTMTVMLNAGNSMKASIRMLLIDALAPLVGIIATFFINLPRQYLVYMLPFFAGGFLYLGACDLLPEAHEKNPPLISVISTLLGFLLIFLITNLIQI